MERFIQTLTSMLLAIPLGVSAQEAGSLELMTTVEKVAEIPAEDGTSKTELLPVETAVPGEEVVYTVTFTNVGEETAENIRITNPIPEEMRYVPGTAFGPGTDVVYSADGGESYAPPGELLVASADGSQRQATPADYTHIRWVLNVPLDAGARGFARFRAVLR
jgi:uncharacterized repeat protein (TIGR01451 family)